MNLKFSILTKQQENDGK